MGMGIRNAFWSKQFEHRLGAGKERKCMDIIQERWVKVEYKTGNDFPGKTR